ncbi:hypothetical protein PI87_21495 [Ralstonia sp. A12]|uniref:DUF7696 family protein n=1 Tax=Ralstonia sp. A12 TaxID=1217052 RepID=UPI000573C013|nr:hypothetical protein [Ralstonia sp. A12]KHK51118.1 hypothetical protein PI87_21495 [Ralstonia sp. A12]
MVSRVDIQLALNRLLVERKAACSVHRGSWLRLCEAAHVAGLQDGDRARYLVRVVNQRGADIALDLRLGAEQLIAQVTRQLADE